MKLDNKLMCHHTILLGYWSVLRRSLMWKSLEAGACVTETMDDDAMEVLRRKPTASIDQAQFAKVRL